MSDASTDAGRAVPRERRSWDTLLAIVLLVALVVLAVVLGLAGAFLVMASDPCGSSVACRTGQLSAGVLVAMFGPAVVTVVALGSVIERLIHARRAFWPPRVGVVVSALVWAGGAALVFGAVPLS